jgi:hypothetical protein
MILFKLIGSWVKVLGNDIDIEFIVIKIKIIEWCIWIIYWREIIKSNKYRRNWLNYLIDRCIKI